MANSFDEDNYYGRIALPLFQLGIIKSWFL